MMSMWRRSFVPVLHVAAFVGAMVVGASTAKACDIALALAVDISGSVDADEYNLQIGGLAAALRDGAVADALARAQARVLLVQWTGDSRQIVSVPWTEIHTYKDAQYFADAVDAAPRAWRNFSTAIGAALAFTSAQFGPVSDCKRRVIDVSGDGISNEGIAPETLRSDLWQQGFTVNGLAIEGTAEDLTTYYWEHVIAGENAFVMSANGFSDYAKRIKLKLLREVTNQLSGREIPHRRLPG